MQKNYILSIADIGDIFVAGTECGTGLSDNRPKGGAAERRGNRKES